LATVLACGLPKNLTGKQLFLPFGEMQELLVQQKMFADRGD
jgi:hypothetical protein